jgi:hypothetical protein
MSIAAVAWAFEQRLKDPTAKLVLIGIADKYNESLGYAYPSMQWLADCADCTRRTARVKVGLLHEMGLVVREEMRTGDTNMPNRYHIPHLQGGVGKKHRGEEAAASGGGLPTTGGVGDQASGGVGDQASYPPETRPPPNNKKLYNNDKKQRESLRFAFDQFWGACPKKIGKKPAFDAFVSACDETEPFTLISAMQAYAKHHRAAQTEGRYIMHPSTWLNQQRWEDELVTEEPGIVRKWYECETKEQFLTTIMGNEMNMNRALQYHSDIFRVAIQKGWISERPKATKTYG